MSRICGRNDTETLTINTVRRLEEYRREVEARRNFFFFSAEGYHKGALSGTDVSRRRQGHNCVVVSTTGEATSAYLFFSFWLSFDFSTIFCSSKVDIIMMMRLYIFLIFFCASVQIVKAAV